MLLASSYLCRGLLGRLKGLWCGHIFIILGAIFLVGPQIFTHTCGLSGKLLYSTTLINAAHETSVDNPSDKTCAV